MRIKAIPLCLLSLMIAVFVSLCVQEVPPLGVVSVIFGAEAPSQPAQTPPAAAEKAAKEAEAAVAPAKDAVAQAATAQANA